MKRIFVIAGWEFMQHFKKRRFWLSTFIAPIILSAIILLPAFYYESSQANQAQVIGCVSLDSIQFCQFLSDQLSGDVEKTGVLPPVLIEPILPDTTNKMRIDFIERRALQISTDSLNKAYKKIQVRRRNLFNRPDSRTKARLLSETYEQLISTREQRDLNQIAFSRLNARLDTLVKTVIFKKADSLLQMNRIAGYLVIDKDKFSRGVVAFNAKRPINFQRIKPLEQALQIMLLEKKLQRDGVQISKIRELLKPIFIEEIVSKGSNKHIFNVMITYLSPVIAVIFLFISALTTIGFLFTTIFADKHHKILETIISSTHTFQILTGKVIGIGMVGLLQILTWILIIALMLFFNLISTEQFAFFTWQNAGIFLLYFVLGYLFWGSFMLGFASLSTGEIEGQHVNRIVKLIILFPVVLIAFVLISPNSVLVRFLSYIPILTPTLMIMRAPFGEISVLDFYLTIGIMTAFIIAGFVFTGKIFRQANLNIRSESPMIRLLELLQLR